MDMCVFNTFYRKGKKVTGSSGVPKISFVFFHRKINLLASTQCLVHMDYCGAVCADLKVLLFNER